MFSFNPIMKTHWLFQKYFTKPSEKVLIVKTTYKDNNFLEPDDIAELEDETDTYWHQVYTLGEWGILGDTIFNNWEIRDLEAEKKHFDTYRNGLDFGYTNDPTAMVRSHYDKARKTIYITGEVYEKKLSNLMIANIVKPIIGTENIICDCAEPKSIDELRQYQINAFPAVKGKDSVMHGIQWVQQQKVVVDKGCQSVINELQLYQWKKDREGNSLNEPVDKFNHAIDALRYSYEDEMRAIEGGIHEGAQSQVEGEDW
jgi:Phage terminase large subunit